jgi:hypothetical protein
VSLDEPVIYNEVEFSSVHRYTCGGVAVVVGRLSQRDKLGPVFYAAARNEFNLHHRQGALPASLVYVFWSANKPPLIKWYA